MADKAKSALSGAAIGTSIVPGIGTAIGAGVGLVASLFSSNKHYNLYYWDSVQSSWVFVLEGHPSAVNKAAATYKQSGLPTQTVRNKSGSAIAPTLPPAGYETASVGGSGINPWIVAGIAGGGIVLWLLLRKGSSPGILGRPR